MADALTPDEIAQALAARFQTTQNGLTTAIANAIRAAAAQAHAEGRAEADREWRSAVQEGIEKIGSSAIIYAPRLYDLFTAEYAANVAAGVAGQPSGDAKGK